MRHPSRVGLYKSRKERLRSSNSRKTVYLLRHGHRNYQPGGQSANKLRIWLRKRLRRARQ